MMNKAISESKQKSPPARPLFQVTATTSPPKPARPEPDIVTLNEPEQLILSDQEKQDLKLKL